MIHLSSAHCQDDSSFGSSRYFVFSVTCVGSYVLSRWFIFRQHTVKMIHLSAVHDTLCLVSFVLVHMCCQDDSSFGSSRYFVFSVICVGSYVLSRWFIFRQHTVKMIHLSAVHDTLCLVSLVLVHISTVCDTAVHYAVFVNIIYLIHLYVYRGSPSILWEPA